jgi:hypothetical protein
MLGEKHHPVVECLLLLFGECAPPLIELVGELDFPHASSIRPTF